MIRQPEGKVTGQENPLPADPVGLLWKKEALKTEVDRAQEHSF